VAVHLLIAWRWRCLFFYSVLLHGSEAMKLFKVAQLQYTNSIFFIRNVFVPSFFSCDQECGKSSS
jgi:hypothetical protein